MDEKIQSYSSKEQGTIDRWLRSVGGPYLVGEDFLEFRHGQLLEIAKAGEDSLLTWDEWQHMQALIGMELPLSVSIKLVGALWENDIAVLELKTEQSELYYKNHGYPAVK